MNNDFFKNNLADLSAQDIANGIRSEIITLNELKETGEFDILKQRQVKILLDKFSEEDNAYKEATTLPLLNDFLIKFPQSENIVKVSLKIENKEKELKNMQRDKYETIKNNINELRADEVKSDLGEDLFRKLCNDLNLDYDVVANFDEPILKFNDIPKNKEDVPKDYTDVFFWGIPSSGKTTALSVILRTMKDKYTLSNPAIETKFGATYRDNLVNIFTNGIGYLPASTQKDRTQYMPFLLKRRGKDKYRQISFFELSGEVFRYLYELENGGSVLDEKERAHVENAFSTLNLLLNSNNQKIHFFFIDYNRETKKNEDKYNLTQENYLSAAATYFRDKNNIFKKKTDAVYVVVTKADEIPGENKAEVAKDFLTNNFGGFMDSIKYSCKKYSVDFNVKVFSIGDIYFKTICKINHNYAENIIEDLLKKIKPVNENKFTKFFNR